MGLRDGNPIKKKRLVNSSTDAFLKSVIGDRQLRNTLRLNISSFCKYLADQDFDDVMEALEFEELPYEVRALLARGFLEKYPVEFKSYFNLFVDKGGDSFGESSDS